MRILQPSYTKNGYLYYLVTRNERAAIYVQYEGDRFVSYEVGKIKNVKEAHIGANTIETGETFWSSEDFGVIAWTMNDLKRAMDKYNEITNEPVKSTAA